MEQSFVIQSSCASVLKDKVDWINTLFGVKIHLHDDPNNETDGIRWVNVQGTVNENITGAKAHIIALCNPELKEHVSFVGFPVFIFAAFEGRIMNKFQTEFRIVLLLMDDGYIDFQGSNVGVTLAISKMHHFHRLNRDTDCTKAISEAMQFDKYVEKEGGSYKIELGTLSNSLKKELLITLDVSPSLVDARTIPPKIARESPTFECRPGPSTEPETDLGIIVISSEDEKPMVVDSSSDDFEDDYEEETEREKRLESDGLDMDLIFPPNFVIKEWLKIHYEGTSDPTDFVNKADMLEHFKSHFDVPDHEDLANLFYDKLAVRIFPLDQNYRNVRTKKTKSKRGKRRLVCFRRRPVNDDDTNTIMGASASQQTNSPIRIIQVHNTSQNTAMRDWNANRFTGDTESLKPRSLISQQPAVTMQPVMPIQPVVPIQPVTSQAHQWQTVRHPVTQPQRSPVPETWLNFFQPCPAPRRNLQQASGQMNFLARQISQMSNTELIERVKPRHNPNLRHIIIDGSNVAMSHGNGTNFSCRGIALCIRFFIERGHKEVTCFVPNYRIGGGGNPPSNDAHILRQLKEKGFVKLTPSRKIRGQNIVCYDDRFVVDLAINMNGVIVSNDQYRDLMAEDPAYQAVIENQLLQYTIVGDILMFPKDPLGQKGPTLEDYLTLPERKNGRRIPEPQKKLGRVPAPLRPQNPVLQTYGNSILPAPPSILPTPPRPWLQHGPTTGAWIRPRTTLSDKQKELASRMLKVLPNKEQDIRNVITNNPTICDIEQLMNILFIKDGTA